MTVQIHSEPATADVQRLVVRASRTTNTGDLFDWAGAAATPRLPARSPAAAEILEDPYWARKIRHGLADSRASRVRSLAEYRRGLN